MKDRLFAILCIVSSICPAQADDWPQWMGPKRENVWRETGIVESFPKDGIKPKWKFSCANGYSGPAVADGLVFLTDFKTDENTEKDNFDRKVVAGKERIFCLNSSDGTVRWWHDYPATYSVSYPNGPRCTPTVSGGKLYTLGAEGDLICFDAKTGRVHWSRDLKKDFNVETPLWGFAGHPLVEGNKLICLVGGEGSVAVAFNKDTGDEVWKALSAKEPGYSPPVIFEANGKRQALIWHPESLNALDPATGKVLWSVKQETVNGTSIMAPRFLGDQIFLGAWQRKGQLLRVDANKPATVWKGTRDTSIYPVNNTPFMEDGHIYGVCTEGELRCVRIKDGARLWETYAPTSGKQTHCGTAHLIKNGDRFFIFGETGDLTIAKLSPKGYEEVSRMHLVDPTSKAFGRSVAWSHPAFAERCVFARNDHELVCVPLAKE